MALALHHYEGSLFSEKIRLMLGYYGLPWESVEISPIMPRPHDSSAHPGKGCA